MMDKSKVDMWMMVRPTMVTKALILDDKYHMNRQGDGLIFTLVGRIIKDNLLRTMG
jgi:hypothetical protein